MERPAPARVGTAKESARRRRAPSGRPAVSTAAPAAEAWAEICETQVSRALSQASSSRASKATRLAGGEALSGSVTPSAEGRTESVFQRPRRETRTVSPGSRTAVSCASLATRRVKQLAAGRSYVGPVKIFQRRVVFEYELSPPPKEATTKTEAS